jgi:NADH-quinone oxidoreductase subunit K
MLIAYLIVGAVLFSLGLVGFVTRRNLIIMFLCTELMFQGIVVNLIGFSRFPLSGDPVFQGQAFALFLLAIAASEAALALALVVLLYRYSGTLDANAWTLMRDY